MPLPRFIQIHSLHSYPGTLLNSDNNGQAKRLTFGDTLRLRISSQCLKRHWRTHDGPDSLHSIPGVTQAIRSRETVNRLIIQPIRDAGVHDPDVLDALQTAFNRGLYGSNGDIRDHRQALLLGLPEIEYLREQALAIADAHPDDAKSATLAAETFFDDKAGQGGNIRALTDAVEYPAGLITTLFGRLVTSDPSVNVDGAILVAHSLTVHQQETESDYFSVVDDLHNRDQDRGAALLGNTELTSGLYYGYVVIDVPTLISNAQACQPSEWLDADRTLATQATDKLIRTIATVSPGSKKGSTAPFAYAEFLLVETGDRQPRTLMNAFRDPVRSTRTQDAISTLTDYLERLDASYGPYEDRGYMSIPKLDSHVPSATPMTLDELALWASNTILSAQPQV